MGVEREYIATFVVFTIAVLVIVGGFASFSGLAVHEEPLKIEMSKNTFNQGDVFDVNVVLNPVTFMSDESIMVYVDNKVTGAIAIKKYLDSGNIEYGSEIKSLGQTSMEIITIKNPLSVNLAEFISLEYIPSGTRHNIRVELSKGDAVAEEGFIVE